MIILHLSHTDIKSDSRILKEMNSLLKLGSNVSVYGIGIKDVESGNASSRAIQNVDSIEIKSKKYKFYLFRPLRLIVIYLEIFVLMLVKASAKKPDVVHCHDVVVLPVAVWVKLLTGARLVYDAHELESQKNGETKLLGKLVLFVEKVCWSFVNGLIVVSPSIARWYEVNVGKKRTEVILNAPMVDSGGEIVSNRYLRETFSIPMDKKIFLYVGLLTPGRGIDLLVKVFRNERVSSHLVFLGSGVLLGELQDESKMNSRLHIHHSVSHDRVTEVARSADYGLCLIQNVSLSDYYCLPNKLFEYTFAGLRVLASNFPDISEVVKKYGLGECVELVEDDVLRAVLKLQNEDVRSGVIGVSALRDLSWEAQELKLLSLYKSL